MGFLSKLFSPMKKVWSKIGKGIKKVFMKIGKFMNKIGVVGQIALGLILPGIGSALGAWAGTASSTVFGAAAKGFVNAAINIGTKVGSVFKTVTQGVTKVIGQTVGTVLNKIPGAGNLIKDLSMGKIDITQMKNFTGNGGVFETAGKVLSDTVNAGKDLFSMDTLTGTNKYAIGKLAPKATDFDIKRGDGIADSVRGAADDATNAFTGTSPADLADNARIAADNATNAFTGTSPADLADSVRSAANDATNAFTEISKPDSIMAKPTTVEKVVTETVDDSFIGKLKTGVSDGKEYLGEKVGSIIPDAIDQTAKTITDLPSNLIKKEAGLIGPAKQGNVYSSQPAQFTAVGIGADSMLMNTGAIQQDMSAGLQGMFGNPSAIFNDLQAKQETENYQAQFGGGR